MNKYKMLCLDIDGTLLNSNHKISEKTKNIINKLSKEKNIPVILVSARMPKGIRFLQEELGITEPIICYSGSLVLDKNLKGISNKYINVNDVKSIYQMVKDSNMHMSLYKDDKWSIEKFDKWAEIEKDITGIEPEIINFQKLFDNCYEEEFGFNKILLIGDEESTSKVYKILNDKYENNLNIYPSKPTYLEIMDKTVSKTKAIKSLLDLYKIEQSEVVAIGDNYNDIDMIEFAGIGIAMGNAPDRVKENANYVTLTNDEDGVAYAIDKYFL